MRDVRRTSAKTTFQTCEFVSLFSLSSPDTFPNCVVAAHDPGVRLPDARFIPYTSERSDDDGESNKRQYIVEVLAVIDHRIFQRSVRSTRCAMMFKSLSGLNEMVDVVVSKGLAISLDLHAPLDKIYTHSLWSSISVRLYLQPFYPLDQTRID